MEPSETEPNFAPSQAEKPAMTDSTKVAKTAEVKAVKDSATAKPAAEAKNNQITFIILKCLALRRTFLYLPKLKIIMSETQNYIQENKQRFLNELCDLLKIASISADPAYSKDVLNCADAVAKHLKEAGADQVEVCETKGYPIVYGEKIIDPKLPTVLVYGHYDVQPPDPLELWESTIRTSNKNYTFTP